MHLGSVLRLDCIFKISTTEVGQMVVRNGTALAPGEAQRSACPEEWCYQPVISMEQCQSTPKMGATWAVTTAGRPKSKRGPGILAFYIANRETVLSPKCHSHCISHRGSEQGTTMLPPPTPPPQSASIVCHLARSCHDITERSYRSLPEVSTYCLSTLVTLVLPVLRTDFCMKWVSA